MKLDPLPLYGSLLYMKCMSIDQNTVCAVTGCIAKLRAKGLCRRHYYMQKRGRDPHKPKPQPKSYVQITVNNRRIRLHRHIMEKFLGRALRSNEHVHHKDGNIHNNAIENLELLSAGDHFRHHIKAKHPANTATEHMCPRCQKVLPIEQFETTVKNGVTYPRYCRPCKNAKQLAWYYKTKQV